MIDRPIRLDQRLQTSGAPTGVPNILPQSRTTLVERFLLVISVLTLPLQDYLPPVGGLSSGFLIFAALAVYVIVNRPRTLGAVWCHPIFIAAYAFIVVSALLEFSSPLSRYSDILRFAQMIGGAVCVAALCRDRSALAAGLYGYIATGLWISVVVYSIGYGPLQEMGAEDFGEASQVRAEVFGDKPLGMNTNALAAWCTQGAIVAFALCLSNRWKHLRAPLLGIVGFCLIASFLPMSRGTAVMSLLSLAAVLYAHGIRQMKTLIFVCVLGMVLYMVVPGAVWSRMMVSTEVRESGKMEARARIYTSALNRLPEYIVGGVGAGNFWGDWGFKKGFEGSNGTIIGPHSSFIAVTIYWGILGLLMFLWFIWCVYRSIPLRCGRDELSLALLGIIVSLGTVLLQTHGFFDKVYTLGGGMLVGARIWIWPTGIVSAIEVNNYPCGADINLVQTTTPNSSKG